MFAKELGSPRRAWQPECELLLGAKTSCQALDAHKGLGLGEVVSEFGMFSGYKHRPSEAACLSN